MSCTLRRFRAVFVALAVASALTGCRHLSPWDPEIALAPAEAVGAVGHRGWGETIVVAAEHVIDEDGDGPYVLDSGDRVGNDRARVRTGARGRAMRSDTQQDAYAVASDDAGRTRPGRSLPMKSLKR